MTARLPLMVRPSAPRYLNFGDRFILPVVVQNQTNAPMQTEIAVRARNARFEGGSETGATVTVPPNDRVEVGFEAATETAGRAAFQIVAASGKAGDAQTVTVPVRTPSTQEAAARVR